MTSLSRLIVLLALMPQLFVLGLGQGLVVCIAPGGHVQVELATSACCAEAGAGESDVREGAASVGGASECSPCTDLRIAVDTRISRAPDGAGQGPGIAAALPLELAWPHGPARRELASVRAFQGALEPPHLGALRCVILRC